MTIHRVSLVLACLTAAAAAVPGPVHGIPAFARKYGVTCAMCHDPIPKLNPYGEQFMANGYVLAPGDTTGTTSAGDPMLMLNSTFPHTKTEAWAAQFNVPVAASGEAVLKYRVRVMY